MPTDLADIAHSLREINARLNEHFKEQGEQEAAVRSRMARLEKEAENLKEKNRQTTEDWRRELHQTMIQLSKMDEKIDHLQSTNDRQEYLMEIAREWVKKIAIKIAIGAVTTTGLGVVGYAVYHSRLLGK